MTPTAPPAAALLSILDAERARGFDGLAGSCVEATVPLRQVALDAALAQVPSWPAPLDALAVEIRDANVLLVTATVRVLGFRTPVRLNVRLAPTLENGLVRLTIDSGSLAATAVALLGPLLGRLPGGAVLEGRELTVDVHQLAALQGLDDLAAMLTEASFRSTRGVLWVTARVQAPVPAATTGRLGGPPLGGGVLPFDLEQLMAWLQGARVHADVRVHERLANDLLGATHDVAQAPSGDGLRDTMTGALQRPSVRFEPGVMCLTATAALAMADPKSS